MPVETMRLRTGAEMPLVGLGTAHLYREKGRAAVRAALDAGYRHIDCAKVYGNERLVGDELRLAMAGELAPGAIPDAPRVPIPRAELFITSKLWNDDHAPEDVAAACRRSLRDLSLDYLDLYLVHWPLAWRKGTVFCPADVTILDTWRAMEKLVDEGLVRAIGVSNFDETQLRARARREDTPAVNQVELHPLCQQPELVAACEAMDVVLTAWSPLGKGTASLMRHPTLLDIARRREGEGEGEGEDDVEGTSLASAADVALRWNTQRGVVVIPKSTSTAHLAGNLRAADGSWSLTKEEMGAVAAMDEGRRRVPDVVGVWPATASSAAKAAGKVLGWIARGVFAVVPNRIDMMAPQ